MFSIVNCAADTITTTADSIHTSTTILGNFSIDAFLLADLEQTMGIISLKATQRWQVV